MDNRNTSNTETVLNVISYECKKIIKEHRNNSFNCIEQLFMFKKELIQFYNDKIQNIPSMDNMNIRFATDNYIKEQYVKLRDLGEEIIKGFIYDIMNKMYE